MLAVVAERIENLVVIRVFKGRGVDRSFRYQPEKRETNAASALAQAPL